MFCEHTGAATGFEGTGDIIAGCAGGSENGTEGVGANFARGGGAVLGAVEVLHGFDIGVQGSERIQRRP